MISLWLITPLETSRLLTCLKHPATRSLPGSKTCSQDGGSRWNWWATMPHSSHQVSFKTSAKAMGLRTQSQALITPTQMVLWSELCRLLSASWSSLILLWCVTEPVLLRVWAQLYLWLEDTSGPHLLCWKANCERILQTNSKLSRRVLRPKSENRFFYDCRHSALVLPDLQTG